MEETLRGTEILMAIKSISLAIDGVTDWGVNQDKLTASQGFLLVYIFQYHKQGTFVTDLHRELGLSKASVSVLIKKLRHKGYLSMEEVPEDDRHKRIIMTEKLQREGALLSGKMRQMNGRIYGGMSREDCEILERLLCRMIQSMKNYKRQEETKHDYDIETDQAI